MSRSVVLSKTSNAALPNKVAAIKGVRGLTKLGLKEAKELVERISVGHSEIIQIDHSVLEPDFSVHIERVKEGGLDVKVNHPNDPVRKGIADEIRRLVTFSTMSAQYDIAKALIDVMETHCPFPADDYEDNDDDRN